MCGEVGMIGDEGGWRCLDEETVRARKEYQCEVCRGVIPQGAYHARLPYIEDGAAGNMRMHLQCRDLCHQAEYWMPDLMDEVAYHPDRGSDWAAHRRAVAVWAAGGQYQREAGDAR